MGQNREWEGRADHISSAPESGYTLAHHCPFMLANTNDTRQSLVRDLLVARKRTP